MTYQVTFHRLVLKEDLPKLDVSVQRHIVSTIRKKLVQDPEQYGHPLQGKLAGYWKLKISHYRVFYQIRQEQILVYVLAIGFRRDEEAYLTATKRLLT